MTTTTTAGEAFGRLAESYDSDFETLPASKRLRRIIWQIYLRHFPPGASLLELNCGTGTDALALAAHGLHVHATDVSAQMLATLNEKVKRSPHAGAITSEQMAFHELPRLHGRLFDGVYSDMGGLNCERDMHRVGRDLAPLIRPGGFFIGTFLGDWAIWEMAAFMVRGKFADAFRRRSPDGIPATVAGALVQTYYFSPRAVVDAFGPLFTLRSLHGLNIFTPPPTSQQAYRRLGTGMNILEHVDDRLMNHAPFNRLGDHFIIVLQRNS